jgi:hypothetical protein
LIILAMMLEEWFAANVHTYFVDSVAIPGRMKIIVTAAAPVVAMPVNYHGAGITTIWLHGPALEPVLVVS